MIPEPVVAARWLHLASCVGVAGACAFLALAGRSDRVTVLRWQERTLAGARWLTLLAVASGVATLSLQAALLEGRLTAALDPGALARVALETEAGRVWLVRHGVLLLLAVFMLLERVPAVSGARGDAGSERATGSARGWAVAGARGDFVTERATGSDRGWAVAGARGYVRADWIAARGQMVVLGLVGLGLLAASGHAAAVEPDTARAIAVDLVHLLAAGVWIGGLAPLALLLRAASDEAGADARAYAVLAARRFSRWALAAVSVLVVTGAVNTLTHVGDVAALVGTAYGRLLLLKVALLVPILVMAAGNRRLLPALSGDGATVGRPAMRRLARFVVAELVLVMAVLLVVAVMTGTPPARHEQPAWPFPWRLSPVTLSGAPALQARVLVGSQVALVGVVAILCALVLRRRRAPLVAGAIVLLAFGAGLALPPLAIDAYPLTYVRPGIPYHASSIASGAQRYAQHCAACHGRAGAGDGPAAVGLPRPPADLRAPHTAHHTAGDLFWWLSRGIPASGMPGFAGTLTEEERWDLVNFVRALAAAEDARRLGPVVERERPRIVAPDATFAVGPTPARALRDYRGRRLVLLTLYTLPGSRPRLTALAEKHDAMVALGVEIVAVPRDGAPDAIKRLGATPPIFFPVVTDGAADIARAYDLFSRLPHAEFLIDRQGYLRAIVAGDRVLPGVDTLLAEVQQLNEEKTVAPPPGDHVH